MSAINVGHKVDIGATFTVRFQSFSHHVGPLQGGWGKTRGEGGGARHDGPVGRGEGGREGQDMMGQWGVER